MPRAKKAPDPQKEAYQRLKEAAFHPSLNELWARTPRRFEPEQRLSLVTVLRTERAMWRLDTARRNEAKDVKRKAAEAAGLPVVEDGGEEDTW